MNMNKIRGNFRINILLTPLKYNKTFLCEILRPACNCMGESVKTCGQSLPNYPQIGHDLLYLKTMVLKKTD